jgi:hypothetical protein
MSPLCPTSTQSVVGSKLYDWSDRSYQHVTKSWGSDGSHLGKRLLRDHMTTRKIDSNWEVFWRFSIVAIPSPAEEDATTTQPPLRTATMNTAPRFRLGQLVGLPRICIRQQHSAKPKQPTTGFQGPEGHGEKIWVWGHRRQEQIIYSFRPQLSVRTICLLITERVSG